MTTGPWRLVEVLIALDFESMFENLGNTTTRYQEDLTVQENDDDQTPMLEDNL
jgi:hypothetical protein